MKTDVAKPIVDELDFLKNFPLKRNLPSMIICWIGVIVKRLSYVGNQRKQFLIIRCERGGVIQKNK